MEEIFKLYNLFKLKEIERRGRVGKRQESSAEHVYGCLILAEYFLPKVHQKLDHLKILRMLAYHELVELETGNIFILDEKKLKTKKEAESEAFKLVPDKVPKNIGDEFKSLWKEYSELSSPEARFCEAINQIEPVLHSLFDKQAWTINKFTEQNLRQAKEKYFEEFPSIKEVFEQLVKYMKERGYF